MTSFQVLPSHVFFLLSLKRRWNNIKPERKNLIHHNKKPQEQTNKPRSPFCVNGLLSMMSAQSVVVTSCIMPEFELQYFVETDFLRTQRAPLCLSLTKTLWAIPYRYRCHWDLNKSNTFLNLERTRKARECEENGNICSVMGLCLLPDSELIYGEDDFACLRHVWSRL